MKLKERLELMKGEALKRKEETLQDKYALTFYLSTLNTRIQDIDVEVDDIVALLRKLEGDE